MDGVADTIRSKYVALEAVLDERSRRLWAAAEARALGHGGIARVVEATGMSRNTIRAGLSELDAGAATKAQEPTPARRTRRPGGGRKRLSDHDPDLVKALELHLEPTTRGDPERPLRWTSLSARRLADALAAEGHPVSERTVNRLLHGLGYSLQSNRKTVEGRQHPDRDAQFRRIDRRVRAFQRLGSRSSRSPRRRRSLSAHIVTAAGNGARRAPPRRFASTTSLTRSSARRSPTASTT